MTGLSFAGPARWRVAAVAAFGLASLIGLAGLVVGGGGAAFAHNYLVSSTPAPGAMVTEPLDAVTLEYSDAVLSLGTNTSFVEVTDAAGTHFETACPTTVDRTVTAPIALGAAGEYRVVWQIVSADGHVVSDQQTFTYQPASGTPEAAGSATAPCASSGAEAAPGAVDSPPADSSVVGTEPSTMLIVAIAGGIVLLALIGVGVVLLLARTRRDDSGK